MIKKAIYNRSNRDQDGKEAISITREKEGIGPLAAWLTGTGIQRRDRTAGQAA
jgi:hypothetical protein